MRATSLLSFLLLAAGAGAQEAKTYTINSIKDNKEELVRDVYRYPEFRPGVVMYTDGVATEARLNYHRLFDQVLFIGPKGDTLALARPEAYSFVTIGTDTFFVQERGYLERLTHYKGVNLSRKSAIKFIGYEKKGLYGTYSPLISAESRGNVMNQESEVNQKLSVDENSVYRTDTRLFLSDEYNNYFPANKRNVHNLFRKQEKKLKEYLAQHDVNYHREQDLLQLVNYLHGAGK